MNAPRALRLWERTYPERFWVDEEALRFNVFDCPLFVPSVSHFSESAFVIVKRSALGEIYGSGPSRRAHVCAVGFRDAAACVGALRDVRASLLSLGFDSWQFGQDWRHFFPGVPAECASVSSVLREAGMSLQEQVQHDVERDLLGYEPPVSPSPFARECTEADRALLEEFFLREFPGRWRSDVLEKFGEEPHRVVGLFLDGACEGFAMTQREGDAHRRAGAVWSRSLGAGWAALGPIGVSSSLRGKGHGHALLAAALCLLRDQGARRTIIDWTVLTAFYGRHGFEVARTYATYSGAL